MTKQRANKYANKHNVVRLEPDDPTKLLTILTDTTDTLLAVTALMIEFEFDGEWFPFSPGVTSADVEDIHNDIWDVIKQKEFDLETGVELFVRRTSAGANLAIDHVGPYALSAYRSDAGVVTLARA